MKWPMRCVLERYVIASAILFISIANGLGQNSATVVEVDPGTSIAFELNRRVRLNFYSGREKSEELDSGKWKFGVGASLQAKRLFKRFIDDFDSDKQHVLVTGLTYEYSRGSEGDSTSIEHKLMLDATGRYAIAGKFLLSNRSRFEFRSVEKEYRFRYRNRIFLERKFQVERFKFTPYGGAEAFWDGKARKWNQFRFTGGVEVPVPILKRTSLNLYYERLRCPGCANPNTNVYGGKINIFFRLKR